MGIREQLYPVKTRLLDFLCDVSAGMRGFNPEEDIIISSYPRSGSTWVAELLTQIPHTALLWEPLHLRNVQEFADLGFGWRQHIPANEEWKEAEEVFRNLFSGRMLNFWLSSRTFPLKFCTADRMIVKFVRANGLLPWLIHRFRFQQKPIFLIRHPFAVAASQMKEGSWDEAFEGYSIPNIPFNEPFQRHAGFLSTLESKPESLVATWCINNQLVLESSRHNRDWITVYYEQILLNPEQELRRIFNEWDMSMPKGILDRMQKASSTTVESTFQDSVKKQLGKWKNSFSDEEQTRMQRVLDYFGMEVYAKDALLPAFMVEK